MSHQHRDMHPVAFSQDVTLDANSDADSIADAAAYAGADVLTVL